MKLGLAGYTLQNQLHQGVSSIVYRALNENKQPCVIKFLTDESFSGLNFARLYNEYKLIGKLNTAHIIKCYQFFSDEVSASLVMEDFGGHSLREWVKSEGLELELFLRLAINSFEALSEVHVQHLIHKDINPENILYNPDTDELKIIDFGISTLLHHESPELKSVESIEGTLAYISPEQTGRMNRGLDYRTDFYSMGVTLYELLTGIQPFESSDPLMMVHAHLAMKPTPPCELCKEIPEPVSNIIMKLIAKNAEDRYKSDFGIIRDLEQCLREYQSTQVVNHFALAQNDLPMGLQIPEKLYGREGESNALIKQFETMADTGEKCFSLVSGYSGVGKSVLIHELLRPTAIKKGYFVSGKFDFIQKNQPLSGLIQALGELIKIFLTQNKESLAIWKELILKELKENIKIIIDLIPDVEYIVGHQPAIKELGPEENRNRFMFTFLKFVGVLAKKEGPIVIFLDDLQWADRVTLRFMDLMLRDASINYLYLIGAYRNNEVKPGHLLLITLDEIITHRGKLHEIYLKPLERNHVITLLEDTFYRQGKDINELADLCILKTQGNPFFLNQFLTLAYQDGLILFSESKGHWSFCLNEIYQKKVSDNVVDLMLEELKKLDLDNQSLLSLAACIGGRFNLEMLSIITEKTHERTFECLYQSLKSELIIPTNDNYKYVGTLKDKAQIEFIFLHDKVQQASYALISDEKKAKTHLKIARLLVKNSSNQESPEQLSEIVHQFNLGKKYIRKTKEKLLVAGYNLNAANRAFETNAYHIADLIYETGIDLLPENSWKINYKLAFQLHYRAAKNALMKRDFKSLKFKVNEIKTHAFSMRDTLMAVELLLQGYTFQKKPDLALDNYLYYLKKNKVKFPRRFYIFHFFIQYLMGMNKFKKINQECIKRLPVIKDSSHKGLILKFITDAFPNCYFSRPTLLPLLVIKLVELSLKYGVSYSSIQGLFCYSAMLFDPVGDFNQAKRVYQLATDLDKSLDFDDNKTMRIVIQLNFITHWSQNIRDTTKLFLSHINEGLKNGEFEYVAYGISTCLIHHFYGGVNLNKLLSDISEKQKTLKICQNPFPIDVVERLKEMIVFLIDDEYPCEGIKSVKKIMTPEKGNNSNIWFVKNLFLMLHDMYSENYHQAYKKNRVLRKHKDAVWGSQTAPFFNFCDSFVLSQCYNTASFPRKLLLSWQLWINQKKMGFWAKQAPINYLHKYYLIEAERMRIKGKIKYAAYLYDKAITGSIKEGFLNEAALACECAVKFYNSRGLLFTAALYMGKALNFYNKWGAVIKIKRLKASYPQFVQALELSRFDAFNALNVTVSPNVTSNFSESIQLDLITMSKAYQIISSERNLDRLIAKSLQIIAENVGAQYAVLVLFSSGEAFIEGRYRINNEVTDILSSLRVSSNVLPLPVVHYVLNKRKYYLSHNAMQDDELVKDSYIQASQAKSILCFPILIQSKMLGVFYLENKEIASVFTPQRLEVLRLLSGQVAISIENARLYRSLGRFVPSPFLELLEKRNIIDVKLGDNKNMRLSVLFLDVRDFTRISEGLTAGATLSFINRILSRMEPIIVKNEGFIDKYIGDALMAIFPVQACDAVQAGLDIVVELQALNNTLLQEGGKGVNLGVGIHTGAVVLGTVGSSYRLDCTVIGDTVNSASRIESLNKIYNTQLLISGETFNDLNQAYQGRFTKVDSVQITGKDKSVLIYTPKATRETRE